MYLKLASFASSIHVEEPKFRICTLEMYLDCWCLGQVMFLIWSYQSGHVCGLIKAHLDLLFHVFAPGSIISCIYVEKCYLIPFIRNTASYIKCMLFWVILFHPLIFLSFFVVHSDTDTNLSHKCGSLSKVLSVNI